MIRASGATVWGKTEATAYGINSSGTVNGDGITFTTYANAHSEGTYGTDSDYEDIKN